MEDAGGVLLLRGVLAADECARWAEAPDFEALLRRVVRADVRAHCERRLGARLACDIDRCWLRRQSPPPHRVPHLGPHLGPHSWHQDGALNADFAADPAPLRMLTCWIALTLCGVDAPGLQWVAAALDRLLTPAELTETRVSERFPAELWRQPTLAAGDALLFGGETLHRTHVTPAMTTERSSVELRLFPADALPARLSADRFVRL